MIGYDFSQDEILDRFSVKRPAKIEMVKRYHPLTGEPFDREIEIEPAKRILVLGDRKFEDLSDFLAAVCETLDDLIKDDVCFVLRSCVNRDAGQEITQMKKSVSEDDLMDDIPKNSKIFEDLESKWEYFTPYTRKLVKKLMMRAFIEGADWIHSGLNPFDASHSRDELEDTFHRWFDKNFHEGIE